MSSQAPAIDPAPVTFSVESFDGTSIACDLYEASSARLVLVVPGFWRERRHPAMQRLARFLTTHGYRAAICDLRGHGESGGVFGFNLHEHHDVSAVISGLLQRTGAVELVLAGLSYGGAIAISTAARHDHPISGLLLISPVADSVRQLPRVNPFTIHRHIALDQALRRPRVAWNFARSGKPRPVDDVGAVHAPVCLIHVKNDWLVDHSHSVALFERANEPKELHIIDVPGNYHADRIFSVAGDEVNPILLDFLSRVSGGETEAGSLAEQDPDS